MGYYSHYIFAKVDEPKQISLSGNPNFVTFANASDISGDKPAKIRIKVSYESRGLDTPTDYKVIITIHEVQSGNSHTFIGVYNEADLNNNSFLLTYDRPEQLVPHGDYYRMKDTTCNFKECLLRNDYIRNNFEVSVIPYKFSKDSEHEYFTTGETVELIAKAAGKQFDCHVSCEYQSNGLIIKDIEPDIRLTLNDIDYESMTEDDRMFYWQFGYKIGGLKPIMAAEIKGSLEPDEAAFEMVKPQAGKYTQAEAQWINLQNLYEHLFLRDIVLDYARFELNEELQSIDFYPTAETSVYMFDKAYTHGNWFNIVSKDVPKLPYRVASSTETSVKNDSFDFGTGLYHIGLDVYTDTGVFLGYRDNTDNSKGKYLTTLSKSYFGQPLWFDLNTLQDKRKKYSTDFLTASDTLVWVDAGTATDYRFIAKRSDGVDTFPFYQSNVLYVLNGYSRTLDKANMSAYVFDRSVEMHSNDFVPIKPLTTDCQRTHIKGQKQYFNFILKDPDHNLVSKSTTIALEYKMYTQSGLYIGKELGRETDCNQMHIVNTTCLDLDRYLPQYKGKVVGRIEVRLIAWYKNEEAGISIPSKEVSEPMIFRILPDMLHTVNDFAFLNRLGGWDSFNFGEKQSFDFKTAASTVYKTLQPHFNTWTEIESVVAKSTQEQHVVQSSAISRSVAEWLKELSASEAVFELKSHRYIIVDDLNLKCNSADDLYQVEMKYRYSDTFNGRIK